MADTIFSQTSGDAGSRLVARLIQIANEAPPEGKSHWLVALVGRPASGKTSLASELARRVNAAAPGTCCVVPMDGYHLTRAQLDQFPDPLHAHAKRGAHWTFDPLALGRKLCEISRSKADTVTVHAFDHAAKDPHFDAIAVPAAARVVIVEGLYLLLTLSPWCEAVAPWFSLRVLLECPAAVCRARGARRNYAAGICASLAASEARWDDSDNRNGALLLEHLDRTALNAVLTQEDAQQLLFPPADSAAASGVGAAGADPGAAGGNAGSGSDV